MKPAIILAALATLAGCSTIGSGYMTCDERAAQLVAMRDTEHELIWRADAALFALQCPLTPLPEVKP